MKQLRNLALIFGIAFLAIGIAGFIPGLTAPHADPNLRVQGASGLLFGLFPVNWLHNLVHVAFGLWGLAVYRYAEQARLYAQAVAIVYAVLTVFGLIPALNTLFGLAPLYGHVVWLHALLALVAGYFGFVHREVQTSAATA
ncbi:MAG TPA: DUF4383 domain-containing protein [Burkholderiaceae bacterium]|jgi:hypothetical protein|nr:DUF4383 domain-containing protein [Burkholderiaceae bacterium]